jgi:hypothetical protein
VLLTPVAKLPPVSITPAANLPPENFSTNSAYVAGGKLHIKKSKNPPARNI